MVLKTVLGWLFLITGLILMVSPFISGFTGFFVLTSRSALSAPANFEITYTVAGFFMAIFGYYLMRPRKETVFS